MAGVTPIHVGFGQPILQCQRHRMGLVAVRAYGNILRVLPVVGHIPVRVDFLAASSDEFSGSGNERLVRPVTGKAGLPDLT